MGAFEAFVVPNGRTGAVHDPAIFHIADGGAGTVHDPTVFNVANGAS